MKSLKESLFDIEKNITKDLTFGDLFEIQSKRSLYGEAYLEREFSVPRIKKETRVTGDDKNDIIFNGIVKTILNIKLSGNPKEMDKEWLIKNIMDKVFFFYQLSVKNKRIYIGFINNGHLILDKDISIFDKSFDTIQINLGDKTNMRLVFKRK